MSEADVPSEADVLRYRIASLGYTVLGSERGFLFWRWWVVRAFTPSSASEDLALPVSLKASAVSLTTALRRLHGKIEAAVPEGSHP